MVLRAVGGERRLVVTPAQADLLTEGFAGYKTVPEVLVWAIAANRCPPLREFYELVVQAHAAGILVAESEPTGARTTFNWPVRLPARFAAMAGGGAVVVSAIVLALALPRWSGPAARSMSSLAGWPRVRCSVWGSCLPPA